MPEFAGDSREGFARGEGEAEKWLHTFYFGNGQPGLRELVSEEHLAKVILPKV